MSSSIRKYKEIKFSEGDEVSNKIEVINYDSNNNIFDPSKIVINSKLIYELIKKYIEVKDNVAK